LRHYRIPDVGCGVNTLPGRTGADPDRRFLPASEICLISFHAACSGEDPGFSLKNGGWH
jgi:hypothetical protein